jgi:hypothetical protein
VFRAEFTHKVSQFNPLCKGGHGTPFFNALTHFFVSDFPKKLKKPGCFGMWKNF